MSKYVYVVPSLTYSASNIGVTLKSGLEVTKLKVVKNSTIGKLGYGFLFVFQSNHHRNVEPTQSERDRQRYRHSAQRHRLR